MFLIGIPAYQAHDTLPLLCKALRRYGLPVVVCDDGSSPPLCADQLFGARLIRHVKNQGKSEAIRSLVREAVQRNFESLLLMDADGQHPVESVRYFLEAAAKHPRCLLIGNRFKGGGHIPFIRRAAIRSADWILTLLLNYGIEDSQCGMRMIPSVLFEEILKDRSKGFVAETKIITISAHRNVQILSLPVPAIYFCNHKSHFHAMRDTLAVAAYLFSQVACSPCEIFRRAIKNL